MTRAQCSRSIRLAWGLCAGKYPVQGHLRFASLAGYCWGGLPVCGQVFHSSWFSAASRSATMKQLPPTKMKSLAPLCFLAAESAASTLG